MLHTIHFDLLCEISKHLDFIDFASLLCVSRSLSAFRGPITNAILVDKAHRHLSLPQKAANITDFKFVKRMYLHFRYHREPDYIDILVYIIECCKKSETTDTFFCDLLKHTTLKNRGTCPSRSSIGYPDLKYMCVYSTIPQFKCVLGHFVIPCSVIAYCIRQLLYNYLSESSVQFKVKSCIDHMFAKHCLRRFSEADGMFLHTVILDLIRHRKTDLIMYFLEKKRLYRVTLSYQIIVNEILKSEYTEIIDTFYDEMRLDHSQVIIDRDIVRGLAERGGFDTLRKVVDTFLGNFIQLHKYTAAIRKGVVLYKQKNKHVPDDFIEYLGAQINEFKLN